MEKLKEYLSYDPNTGWFTWIRKPSQRVHVGDIAGTITTNGYVIIRFGGYEIQAHTLAWYFAHGQIIMLDHENRIRHENWIDNLRPANYSQNGGNRTPTGELGVKGVSRKGNKFTAQITCDYVNYYLGVFDTIEEASKAYQQKAKEVFGAYANG